MAAKTYNQASDEIRALVAGHIKMAGAGPAVDSQVPGPDPNSMPGSEHDKPAPDSVGKDDPMVAKVTITDNGSRPPVPFEQRPAATGKAPSHKTEPESSADFFAALPGEKSAAAMANHLLAVIHELTSAPAPAPAPTTIKQAAAAGRAAAAPAKPTAQPAQATPTKQAAPAAKPTFQLDQETLAKLASVVLASKEGYDVTEALLSKMAGAEAAKEAMAQVVGVATEAQYLEGLEKGAAVADEAILAAVANLARRAGQEEVAGSVKAAADQAASQTETQQLEEFFKQASPQEKLDFEYGMRKAELEFQQGQEKAAADAATQDQMLKEAQAGEASGIARADAAVRAAIEAVAAGQVVGHAAKQAQEGAPPPEAMAPQPGGEGGGGGDAITQLVAILQQLVQSGEVTEEAAQAALEQLAGGSGGGGGGGEAAPAEGEGEAAPPPAEAGGDDPQAKAASVTVNDILAALQGRR